MRKVGVHRLEVPEIPDFHVAVYPGCGHPLAHGIYGYASDRAL